MTTRTKSQPAWYCLSHHDRYRRLNKVRRVWGRCHYEKHEDRRGRTVYLNGAWINDIPSLYLSLGEAVNGPNGYFGGCLNSLADCFCGGFGVFPPLTIRLSHFEDVRKALDGRAWCRYNAELCHGAVAGDIESLAFAGYFGDGSPADVARWTAIYEAAFAGEAFDYNEFNSYFDALVEFLTSSGAELIPEQEEADQ